jgi:hypothetical protein
LPTTPCLARACLAAFLPALARSAGAQEDPLAPPPAGERDPAWTFANGRTLGLFPAGDLHPAYIADPHKPENGAMAQLYTRSRIHDTTSRRFALKAGGRFGVMRLVPGRPDGRSWQLSIDAGLDFQVDSVHKQDSIGWDGSYGLTLTTSSGGPWSFKAAHIHTSGHVGDEYAERTGRLRIDYTRAELAFGAARRIGRGARAYAELGWAYHLLTEEQRARRWQAGFEYQSRRSLFGGRFAWYAAVDFQAMAERDWRLDTAIQAGIASRAEGRRWRFGVQYDDGRAPMTEFFEATEAWFSFGFWVDL